MRIIKKQELKELAETLKNIGEDHLEEKGEILKEFFRLNLNFEGDLEPEVGAVFARAVLEITAVLDGLHVS